MRCHHTAFTSDLGMYRAQAVFGRGAYYSISLQRRSIVHRKHILPVIAAMLLGPIVGSASAKLVGHWRMNEGGGTVAYDTSGYGNNGTLQGNPAWTAGVLGGALQLTAWTISF